MKKQILFFAVTIATLFSTLTASAQGEWKWAHYWTGGGGNLNEVFNKITNTAFDEEGNIYVYGTMGGNARLDGEMLMFSSNSDVITTSEHSILLAKFDTSGTMLWYKVIKCQGDYWSIPKWMTVKNDRIYITGITGMWTDRYYWLYYIDTLITKEDVLSLPASERKPPYKRSRWTFFSQLDLDGNRIEDHFVETYTREYHESGNNYVRGVKPISTDEYAYPTPMHIDNEGNIYLFAQFQYAGNEEDPYTVVIDGDSSKTYDLYLPGSSCGSMSLHNVMIYKFTPNGKKQATLHRAFYILKLAATTGVTLTMMVTVFFLAPTSNGNFIRYFMNSNFFMHLITPLLCIISFIFFEPSESAKLTITIPGILPMLLYSFYYTPNILIHLDNGKVNPDYDWYNFLAGGLNTIWFVIPLLYVVTWIFALGLWAANKKLAKA